MNTTNKSSEKGFVFSFDLMIAFTAMLMVLFFIISIESNSVKENDVFLKEIELEKNGIFLADSIVKNFDENNSFYGAALFDFEKQRVKSNEINSNLENFIPIENSEFFVKKISAKLKNGIEKNLFNFEKPGKNCISIERFVLFSGEMALLNLVVCNE